jgi:PST family polysaccharide transporter
MSVAVSRRLAFNAYIQVGGEVISRLLMFALYAVMARRLGLRGFGDFTFALSLTGLMLLADSAVDDILVRDIARARSKAGRLAGDALAAKLTVGALVGSFAIAFVLVGDYSWTVRGAVCLLIVGAIPELGITTIYAVLRGVDDFRTGTLGLLIMRTTRATLGVTILLIGGGILLVASSYAAGALVALAITVPVLAGRRSMPRPVWSRGAIRRVLSRVWPVVAAGALDTILISAAPIVLSALKGNAAVGAYGAGIRLALIAQFLSIAVGSAVLPTAARTDPTTTPTLGEIVEATLKITTVALVPLTLALALFAHPIVTFIYGHGFGAAVTPTRLLAALVLVRGVAIVTFIVLLARDRLASLLRIPAAVLLGYVVLLAAVVPAQAENGAAAATLIMELAYAALMVVATVRVTGPVSLARVASGALVGSAATLGTGAAGCVVALLAYVPLLVLWEYLMYPGDLHWIATVIRVPRPVY